MEILGLVDFPLMWMLLPLSLLLLYLYSTWTFSTWSSLGVPGPKPSLIYGNLDTYRKLGLTGAVDKWKAEHGPTVGVYFARNPVLVTTDLDILKEVFVKQFDNFHLRNLMPHNVHRGFLDKMLFIRNGKRWKRHRQLMSPTFSAGKLRGLMGQINRCGKIAADVFGEMAVSNTSIHLREKLNLLTMDVIAATEMGLDLNLLRDCEVEDNQPIIAALKDSGINFAPDSFTRIAAGAFPVLAPLFRFLNTCDIPFKDMEALRSCVVDVVRHRDRNPAQSQPDYLQYLMNLRPKPGQEVTCSKDEVIGHNDKYMTEEEVLAETVQIILAGFETTGSTLRFMVHNLAENPEEQQKLYDEIQDVIGEGDVTYENVARLKYLEKIIMETLRLYPPIPFVTRQALDTVTIRGVTIPKDTTVFIPLYHILRDPANFQEPNTFRPDRSHENQHSLLHSLPFGSGPRRCIGMRLAMLEIKTLAVHFFRKLKFVPCEVEAEQSSRFTRSMLLNPDKPLVVKAELRH